MSNTVGIPLTQGKVALISDEDVDRVLSMGKWAAVNANCTWYAAKSRKYGRHALFMHQFIMQSSCESDVDHRDRNGLNNQRDNLRLATRSQNLANQKRRNEIGFKGIARNRNKFRAQIQCEGKSYRSPSVDTKEEAAHAYDVMAIELFGEFALPNFDADGNIITDASTCDARYMRGTRRLYRNNTSGFIGVRRTRYGKFEARVGVNGSVHVGTFDTEEDAARARDDKAIEIYGSRVDLNFERPLE